MQVTDEMLAAAMKKAVEAGLIQRTASGEAEYLRNWELVRGVVQAALDAI